MTPTVVSEMRRLLPYVAELAVEWMATTPDEVHRSVAGTMVFIDVSGFTALTERLARRGRAGAEELTEILDRIFARLLTLAWESGGGLVKFGGDALLLLFTGDDHVQRACAAAHDMRGELDEIGDIRAGGRKTTLQMSVGIHTGDFDWFLVGARHRELVLAGPAATRTVEAEGAAVAGQILVSSAVARQLDRGVLGDEVADGRLLVARPAVGMVHHVPAEGELEAVERCVPEALRSHLASGVTTAEHRKVTVGFVHFMGLDTLLANEGSDAAARAVEQVVDAAQALMAEHELTFLGTDVYDDGGKLILVAGVPDASDNDEERMLRAMRGLFDQDLPLRLRGGVNHGHVYAGDVGAAMRRTYTVMGDAVNVAARLMSAAEPGQVLVTGSVLDRSRTEFDTQALPPLHVKGKSRPLTAFALGELTGSRTHRSAQRLPLIGRDDELDVLLAAADRAASGHGCVVQVLGPAGIGKSRVIEELRSRRSGHRQLSVVCEQYEASTPFAPVKLLLRRLLDLPTDVDSETAGARLEQFVSDQAPELAPWVPLLAIPVDAEVPSTPEVEQLGAAFRQGQLEQVTFALLAHLVTEPTILVVEDAFWADDASGSLLRHISAEVATQPWLIVVATRVEDEEPVAPEGEAGHHEVVELHELGHEAMRALATRATERAPRPVHEIEALAERADGNPLFLLELVSGTAAGSELPDTIEAAITARIDVLEPQDRIALRSVAVLGIFFPLSLAEEALHEYAPVVTDPSLWERLDEFLERDAVDRVHFRQGLVRDVAYEGLPFARRREIHAEVATRLERDAADTEAIAELLALHFLRAEQFDRALVYSRMAGDGARANAATADAAGLYQQALVAARRDGSVPPEEVAAIARTLGDVSELAGLYDEARRAYRAARQLVADPRTTAELFHREGFMSDRSGHYLRARRLYRVGLRLARAHADVDGMEEVRAELEVSCASALIVEGRYAASIWWAQQAASRAQDCGAQAVLAHAYYLLDWAYTDLGSPDAERYRGLAFSIYEELGDLVGQANVLNNLGANAYVEGRWEEALAFQDRNQRMREKAGDLVQAATAGANRAEVLCQQGHHAEAEVLLRDALTVFRGAGYRVGTAWAMGYLGLAVARQGDVGEGRRMLEQSRDLCRELGVDGLALEVGARLGEVRLLAHERDGALAVIQPALAAAKAKGGIPFAEAALERIRGYALAQAGDMRGATRALEASRRHAEASEARYELALTLRASARIGALVGRPDEEAAERSDSLLAHLGVVDPGDIPLPQAGEPHGTRPG